MDETGKILLRAAKLIEQRGWTQGTYEDGDGCLCVLGAIVVAELGGRTPKDWEAATMDASAVYRLEDTVQRHANAWNDKRGRTAEEVIDALIAAAYWEQ